MTQPAIQVQGIGKQYQLGLREKSYQNFREAVVDLAAAPFRRLRHLSGHSEEDESFWALRDISFDVPEGEVLGIIGRNGAGKSTLLKILSRITEPTEGRALVHGRVASLLEVGTGFHPELTGRENIYLNGAILGMSKAEITRKFDEIVDFSGVEKFLDTPIKRYSSGMKVRLAFAVAANLEPEILIIDEVLAVGDAEFQKKCLGKMENVARGGRTVLFVSHNMAAVESLCERVLFLERGNVASSGNSQQIIREYLERTAARTESGRYVRASAPEGYCVLSAEVCSENEFIAIGYPVGSKLTFNVTCSTDVTTKYPGVGIGINNEMGQRIVTLHSVADERCRDQSVNGVFSLKCHIDDLILAVGRYSVKLALESRHGIAEVIDPAFGFQVLPTDLYGTVERDYRGIVLCSQKWSLQN